MPPIVCLPLLGIKPKKICVSDCLVLQVSTEEGRGAVSDGTRTQVSRVKYGIYLQREYMCGSAGEFASSADRIPSHDPGYDGDRLFVLSTPRMAVVLIRKLDASDVGVAGGYSTIPLHRLGANGTASQPVR